MKNKPQSINISCSSNISEVDAMLNKAMRFLKSNGVVRNERCNVVLRELAMNAVVHGNRTDVNKRVSCSILIDEDKSVEITVADQGKGFDYRSLDFALPDRPAHLERRGYILIGNMADAVRFNGAGNVVTAILKMNEKQDAKEG